MMSGLQFKSVFLAFLFVGLAVCNLFTADQKNRKDPKLQALPSHAPRVSENVATAEKVRLGKDLFFDKALSGNNQMSCASCHAEAKAFSDGLAKSIGAEGKTLTRNAPSVLNAGFHESLFWDGRAKTLEEQALMPIVSKLEMNQPIETLIEELEAATGYRERFLKVFDTGVSRDGIAKALAAYQRSLVSQESDFDRYMKGDRQALSAAAKRCLELFDGEAGCVRCHNGAILSDGKFYRLGIGRGDLGRGVVTGLREDRYRFRTPSLRDVELTAPYMHDGSLKTLNEVVEFYYRGVPLRGPDGLEIDIEPLLDRSFTEIDDLVAFLKSLTGSKPTGNR